MFTVLSQVFTLALFCVQLDGVFQRLESYRVDETTGSVYVDGEEDLILDESDPIEGLTFSLQNRASPAGCPDDRVELVTGGAHVPVTFASRNEYRSLVRRHYTRECDVQIAAIRCGLITVIPPNMLLLMSGEQLRTRVCGQLIFDIERLKTKLTIYSSTTWSKSDSVKWLWEALEKMSNRRRSLFFRFVTGLSRLPRDPSVGLKMEISEMGQTDVLPLAHTCSCNIEVCQIQDNINV